MRAVLRSPLIGVVLLVLLAGWSRLSHPDAPEATSGALACLVLAGGLVVGWLLGRWEPAAAGLLVLAIAVGTYAVTWPDSMSGDPLAPPLGYLNANGALLVCGAAGTVVASHGRGSPWRLFATLVALLVGTICWINGADAATAAAGLLAVWSVVGGRGPAGLWTGAGALLVVVPGALPLAWGAGWLPRPQPLVSALSEQRFVLWQDAVDLMSRFPVRGAGPGRFYDYSTIADPDLQWAHSYWLQAGAELGWVGLAAVLLLLVWATAALGRNAMLLGLVLLPASIDYVLDFGGVLLAVSLVVGGALGSASGTGKPWLTPPSP